MQPCRICGKPGQRHHIIYRSHGGLNIKLNYESLCYVHHNVGPDAVHNNYEFDHELKYELQEMYFLLFMKDEYRIEEIAELIGYEKNRLQKRMKSVPQAAGLYRREDIIRYLMGGMLLEDWRVKNGYKNHFIL